MYIWLQLCSIVLTMESATPCYIQIHVKKNMSAIFLDAVLCFICFTAWKVLGKLQAVQLALPFEFSEVVTKQKNSVPLWVDYLSGFVLVARCCVAPSKRPKQGWVTRLDGVHSGSCNCWMSQRRRIWLLSPTNLAFGFGDFCLTSTCSVSLQSMSNNQSPSMSSSQWDRPGVIHIHSISTRVHVSWLTEEQPTWTATSTRRLLWTSGDQVGWSEFAWICWNNVEACQKNPGLKLGCILSQP